MQHNNIYVCYLQIPLERCVCIKDYIALQ